MTLTPRWVALQATHEAVALAHSLLHGWQVQQVMTQGCLTQWQQTLKTLDTAGVALQRQAETHQAQTGQLRRAPWWALLAGVGLMALVAGWLGGAAHRATTSRQARVAGAPARSCGAGAPATVRRAPQPSA